MKCLKENWKFLLIITILCIIGGYFIILYTLDSMDPKLFEEGIKHTLDYILSHKECQTEDPEFDKWCDKVISALENARKEIVNG